MRHDTAGRTDVDMTQNTNLMGTGPMVTNLMVTNQMDTNRMGTGIKATVLATKVMANMLNEEIGITAPVVSQVNMN